MDLDAILARLDQLETHERIRALIADYAFAADTQDFELLGSVFAPDAVMDMGGTMLEGRESIVSTMASILTSDFVAKHFIVNEKITWTSGTPHTRAYVNYTHAGPGVSAVGWGTYDIDFTADGSQVTRMIFAGNQHLPGTVPEAMARIDDMKGA
ncbi:MAG: SnoaL-like domain [Actinomycetota bacterium]